MTPIRMSPVTALLLVGIAVFALPYHADAVLCNAIVGEWAWFTGSHVTLHPDGTITSRQLGKLGTWECTNTARGVFTLR